MINFFNIKNKQNGFASDTVKFVLVPTRDLLQK